LRVLRDLTSPIIRAEESAPIGAVMPSQKVVEAGFRIADFSGEELLRRVGAGACLRYVVTKRATAAMSTVRPRRSLSLASFPTNR
jgi:hypothetical protein